MATLVDYRVISDGPFELMTDEQAVFSVTIESDLVEGTNRAKPILAFLMRPFEQSEIEIDVNDREILSANYNESVTRGLWEPFLGTKLHPGGVNTIQFRVLNGRARFDAVVLWYQRNV